MKTQLVQKAVDLFIETLPLDTMNPEHPLFEQLYDKECMIFTLFGQMSEEELEEYRQQVAPYKIASV
jgi:hypothetical protein